MSMLCRPIGSALIPDSSHASTSGLVMLRIVLPEYSFVIFVPSSPASTNRPLRKSSSCASSVPMKMVPHHTPSHPMASAAASPRPSPMPPAAITGVSPATSRTCGSSASVPIRPVCPPASVPCATTASTPAASTFCAPFTLPTSDTILMPASRNWRMNGEGSPSPVARTGTPMPTMTSIWDCGSNSALDIVCSPAEPPAPRSRGAVSGSPSLVRSASTSAACADGIIERSSALVGAWSEPPFEGPRTGSRMSTPNGLSVSSRMRRISRSISSGPKPVPPSTPSPPAFETAATRSGPATPLLEPPTVGPMPARRTGYSMPRRSQIRVRRTGRVMGRSVPGTSAPPKPPWPCRRDVALRPSTWWCGHSRREARS